MDKQRKLNKSSILLSRKNFTPRYSKKMLDKFIKSLVKSGVLDWVEKMQKKFSEVEVYLVGGAVRDAILGVQDNKDYDFVVRKVPMKKLEEFLNKLGWVEKLGRNFGVLKFRPTCLAGRREGLSYNLDIALPRSEMSISQGAYKDFKVKFDKDLNIEQDLLRRDFTINAVAIKLTSPNLFKLATGNFKLKRRGINIVDPFNGVQDVKEKKIRCVGSAKERLSEDYTRMLRAVRFACQLDFNIAQDAKKVIKKLAPHLNDFIQTRQVKVRGGHKKIIDYVAPREVIAKELLRAFNEDYLRAIKLYDELGLFKVLMPEVLKMKKCPQPKNYHSEGDVWIHTILALDKMNSGKFKAFEKKLDKLLTEELKNKRTEEQKSERLELILSLLFHDIGKPYTIQTPKKDGVDRIRFNDHDNLGADIAHKICERLKLSAPEKLGIESEQVAWLVRKHMMLIHGHPSQFRPTTIEKYFFSDRYPGKNLIKLAYLDSLATIPKSGKLEFDLINALLKRIKAMKSLVKKKKAQTALPEPLLDGDEIMQICQLKPGKKVGQIKDKLREEQLNRKIKSKKQAKEFVKEMK